MEVGVAHRYCPDVSDLAATFGQSRSTPSALGYREAVVTAELACGRLRERVVVPAAVCKAKKVADLPDEPLAAVPDV
jgi:hypothetical protein